MALDTFKKYVEARHALCNGTSVDGKTYVLGPDAIVQGKDQLEWIYGVLTILDAKASSLMALNGVMLAAGTFLLDKRADSASQIFSSGWIPNSIDGWMHLFVVIACITSVVSIFLCLYVVRVTWGFLGKAESSEKDDTRSYVFTTEFNSLQNEASLRTTVYRGGWCLSQIATGSTFAAIVLYLIRNVLGA